MRILEEVDNSNLTSWQNVFLPNVFGDRYETIRKNLINMNILNAYVRVRKSRMFSTGELSHIVLKGTNTRVGYIGNETLELFCPQGQEPSTYRTPHKHLRRIFRAC